MVNAQLSSRPEPLDLHTPFTRADAIAAGISQGRLRGLEFRRVFHGVYVLATVPEFWFDRRGGARSGAGTGLATRPAGPATRPRSRSRAL